MRRSEFIVLAAVALGFMACGGSDQSDGAAGASSVGGSPTGGSPTGGGRPSTGGVRATSGGAPARPSGGSSGQLATGGDSAVGAGGDSAAGAGGDSAAGAGGTLGGVGGSDGTDEGGAASAAGEAGAGGAPNDGGPRGFVIGYANSSRSYLQFELLIVNDSDRTVSVDSLEVRYYLTDEGALDGSVDYGMLIGPEGAVAELQSTYFLSHLPIDPPRDGANGYLALTSNYDYPFEPGQRIRLRVHFDSLKQIPYNDYSYVDTGGELIEAESMSLFVDDELVWGNPP